MVKILHVIQILTLGGGARALLATAKCSGRQGDYQHTVVSILPPEEKALKLARESGLRVVVAPGPADLAAEIEAADIVQMHWWNVPEMTDFIRSPHPAMRLIGFYHVAGDSLPHIITPKLMDYVDVSVACNPYTFYDNPVFRDMDPEKKLTSAALVYGAADLDRLDGLTFRPHDGFNIGYIGTIDFIKMHPDYVKMSAAIKVPAVKFIVCGDGSLDLLRRQAAEAGAAERFEFRGYVEDVRPAIGEFDIYGYPLCEETYAGSELNLQEVMYAGLAPVVFPYGGVKRLVVDDFTGLIVHSAREYAQAIEYLYLHPAERRRLGRNAKAYAEQIFGAENAARKLNLVYRRLLERPKRVRQWPSGGPLTAEAGAEVFLDTLGGDFGADYVASRSAPGLREAIGADDRVAAATRVAFISGVLAYRGKYPGDPWLRYWAGLGFARLGSHAEAALEFAEAIKLGFPHWRARWRLAQATRAAGRADLAQTVLAQLEALHPGYAEELEAATRTTAPAGEAVSPVRPDWSPRDRASASEPKSEISAADIATEVTRAEKAFKAGRAQEAEGILQAVLAGSPRHPRALNNLGVVLYAQGRKEEGLIRLRQAVEADSAYSDALINLLEVLVAEGRHAEALQAGYASLERSPENDTLCVATASVEEDWADKMMDRSQVRDLGYVKRPFRITALVSTYKSEAFMRECLDDLEAQTVARDLEIVIVDADSPEREIAIVEEYQRRYDNIRYIRTPERIGIYSAWNLAIRAASGAYLTPMSTNDRLAPDAYEKLIRALDGNPGAALAYGDSHLTRVPHQTFADFTPVPAEEASFVWPEYAYDDLVVNCRVGPHPVWRASLHGKIGYFDGRYKAISDQDFWLRIAIRFPLLHVPAYTGLVWLTQDSLSGQSSSYHEIRQIHNLHASAYLSRIRRRHAVEGYTEASPADSPDRPFSLLSPQIGAPASVFLSPPAVRVSAIVSAFDSEKFIRGCLEDLTSQSLFRRGEMEIVVVDSGSRQGEGRIVEEFRARHDRIVYLRTERETIYGAWNRGVQAAHGRYLVNANADDRHREDAFDIMADRLDRASAGGTGPALAYADALLTRRENDAFPAHAAERVWALPDWSVRQALVDCPFGCTVMWRRNLHAKLGLFDARLKIAGDYEFFFRAALADGALHIRIPLTLYLENPASLSYGGGNAVDAEVHGFLAPFRRRLPLDRIYPYLRGDRSPEALSASAIDLAVCLLDPYAGRIAPADAEARLWQALDAAGPSGEALIDLVMAAQMQGKTPLAQAAFTRLLAYEPAFAHHLKGRDPLALLFRREHPSLAGMPALVKVGDTRVPMSAYQAGTDARPIAVGR